MVYQSKIALVLRRLQSEGMDRSLQRLNMMMQAAPDLADHVDWDHCFRLSTRVDGAPESMLRPWADVPGHAEGTGRTASRGPHRLRRKRIRTLPSIPCLTS